MDGKTRMNEANRLVADRAKVLSKNTTRGSRRI